MGREAHGAGNLRHILAHAPAGQGLPQNFHCFTALICIKQEESKAFASQILERPTNLQASRPSNQPHVHSSNQHADQQAWPPTSQPLMHPPT